MAEVQGVIYRSPHLYGLKRSRWWLDGIRQAIPWLKEKSSAGIHQMLKRFGICYKRGRIFVHSPDLFYNVKIAAIEEAKRASRANPDRIVFLYQDEHSFFKQPSVAPDYAAKEGDAKKARLYAGSDAMRRVAGCLDINTGALITMQRNHFAVPQMIKFFTYVEEQYPNAETIYIALDNWPVHYAPVLEESLKKRKSTIRFLFLPTYAPWTNPIEKVWRVFQQEFQHMHPFSRHWKDLRETVDAWFDARRGPNPSLLYTVGLGSSP